MEFNPADHFSLICFALILLAVLGSILATVHFVDSKKTLPLAIGIAVWLGALSFIVASGFIEAAPMPRLVIFMALINIVSAVLGFSSIGKSLALGIPLSLLVGFQSFRLPLELVLHSWANQGTIPMTMTWSGANFDIVSGVVALLAAPFAGKNQALAWIANIVGFVLLINVMRVAVLSSPLPFAWAVTPTLQLGFHLPYALIVPICVGGALFGHIVLTRALLTSSS